MQTQSNIENRLKPALVRVKTRDNTTVGMGFLVAKRTLITCTHVVKRASTAPVYRMLPSDPIAVEFIFSRLSQNLTARVTQWSLEEANDVAVLELDHDPPHFARPLDLTSAADGELMKHRFYVFGFPVGSEGKWAQGRLMSQIPNGWIQLQDDNVTGARIEEGFSGTPVWDDDLNTVVGMVVAKEIKANEKVAYAIPAQRLYGTLFGSVEPLTGNPRLGVLPSIIDLGYMTGPAAYHAYIRISNLGTGHLKWLYGASGYPMETHRVDNGIHVKIVASAGPFYSSIGIQSTGGVATVRIAGERQDAFRVRSLHTSLPIGSTKYSAASFATARQAVASLQAWAAAKHRIPDDLFDGELVIEEATSVRIRVTRLLEERTEDEITVSVSKGVPTEEYEDIGGVRIPTKWSTKGWTGLRRGSATTTPCIACGQAGSKRCPVCSGRRKIPCKKEVRCKDCRGRGKVNIGSSAARCYSCNGSGKSACPDCGGSGVVDCPSCNALGRTECDTCEGAGNLIRYVHGTISYNRTSDTYHAWPGDGAEIRGVLDTDYESVLPSKDVIERLPAHLRKALLHEFEQMRQPAELFRVEIDMLPVIAVGYRYSDYAGVAYMLGSERRVKVPLAWRDRHYLRKVHASRYPKATARRFFVITGIFRRKLRKSAGELQPGNRNTI
jgi:hypothetical protein